MKTYRIQFQGMTKGAIGIFQRFVEVVKAENEKEALWKLYNKYDSVHFPKIEEVKD